MTMRVLHVINSMIMGGAQRLVDWLSNEQVAQGLSVGVLSIGTPIEVLARGLREGRVQLYTPQVGGSHSPLGIGAVASTLRRFRPDIVHVHLFPAQLWSRIAVGMTKSPAKLVLTEHSTWNRRRPYRWGAWVDRYVYGSCERIACISPAVRDALVAWLPDVTDRTEVIPCGIPIRKTPHRTAAPSSQLTVGCVSRLEEVKGVDVLVDAIADVEGAKLVVAGDGSERGRLVSRAVELRVTERTTFLGEVPNIGAVLSDCDVYVQPSRVDGFGIAAVEAMAAGLPVIASDIPGLRETVADGGRLFPSGDSRALAAQLRSLRDAPAERARLAVLAVERARAFDIRETARAYRLLYERVLGTESSARGVEPGGGQR